MMEENEKPKPKLQVFYESLVKSKYAVPDYATFEETLKDPVKSKEFYDALKTANYDLPEFEIFETDLGLKKKDASDYGLPTKQVFEDMFSTISKENSEVSRKPVDYETQFSVPKPSFKVPEPSGYPQTLTENLIGQVASRAYRDYSDKEKFKEYATAKLIEIDKELEGLKEYAPTITQGAPPYIMYTPPDKISEGVKRREELLRQKGELKSALSDPKKWDFLLGQAINGSLVGMAAKIYAGEMAGNENLPYELDPEWINKYDANWKESVAAMVMSLTLDGPLFKPLGIPGKAIGDSGARFLTKKLVNDTAKKLIKTGIPEAEALKLAQKGAQKLSYAIPTATRSASSLGGYEGLANFLTQLGDPEKDLKDINYGEILSSYGRGFALGLGTGLTGVGTAMASQKAKAIPSVLGRLGAQAGIQTTGLAAESGVFSVGGALLDGKKLTDITKQDFGETVALLAALKISHAIQDPKATRLGLRQSLAYDPQKPGYGQFKIEMQPWEIETLGSKDYTTLMKELSKDDTKLGEILSNENVPAYLKQKLLWGSRGVAMENANIMADKVSVNGEYVDFHNKEGVLVDRRKFYNQEDAERYGIDWGLQLEDGKAQMNGFAPEVDRIALLGKYKMQGGDVQKLFASIDKDPATRTPEEWDTVGKFYSMIPKPKEPEKPTGGEEKPGEEKPEEVKAEEKPEIPEEKPKEEVRPPAPKALSQYLKGDVVQDKAGQQFEVVEPAKMGGGQAKLKNLKTKELIGFDSQSIDFTPVQREIKVRQKGAKTPESIQKAINEIPNDFEDVVRQYILEGKKISREDFIANTGWSNEDIRKSGIGFFLSKEGAKLDVFHENIANSFGMEEKGAMDMANAITRILMESVDPATNKISKWSVLKAFNKRRAGAEGDPFVPTQEDLIREREDNMTPDEVENEAPAVTDEAKNLFEGDEVAQVFKSGRYETEEGGIDWAKLKDIAEKNPEHFKEFPWNMTDKEFENLKTIINDTEKQRSVEELNKKPGATEESGEGDNIPGGTAEGEGRTEGEGKEKPVGEIDKAKSIVSEVESLEKPNEYLDELTLPKGVRNFFASLKKSDTSKDVWSVYGKGFQPKNGREISDFFSYVNSAMKKGDLSVEAKILKDKGFDLSLVEKADAYRIWFKNGVFLTISTGQHKSDANYMYAGTQVSLRDVKYKKLMEMVKDGKITEDEAYNIEQGKETVKAEEPKPPEQVTEEEKPVEKPAENLSPEQQKQIEGINKEYDALIQKQRDIIPKAEADMRKALLEADERNGLFGDTKPLSPDEIIKREEQGFTYNEETRNAVRKPFEEKIAEANKEVARLEKERESKIGEVKKQLGFDWNKLFEPPTEEEQTQTQKDIKEEEYQKSSFDKKWAPTREIAIEKLKKQISDAQARIADWSSRVYKKSGGKTVEVGKDNDYDYRKVSVDDVNERRRQQVIRGAQQEIKDAVDDLKKLGVPESEVKKQMDLFASPKEEKPVENILRSPEEKHTDEEDIASAQKEVDKGFNAFRTFFRKKGETEWRKAYLMSAPFLTESNALKSAKYQLLADNRWVGVEQAKTILNDYEFRAEKIIPELREQDLKALSEINKATAPSKFTRTNLSTKYGADVIDRLSKGEYILFGADPNKFSAVSKKGRDTAEQYDKPKPPTTNKAQREALDDFVSKLNEKGGNYIGSEESSAGLVVKYKLKGDKSEREATIFKDGQMTPGAYGETEKPLPKKGDQIKFSRGGREWTADVLHVYPDGRVDVDVFGRKTINPDEYTIVPKKGGGGGGVESFRDTPRAKNQKKLKTEPLAENPEEIAWNEPLPISTNEDPNFKMSDLNDSMSIRNIARNFVKNLGLHEGMDVRSGMISRFARKARAIFNPTSGIIRVKNIRDLRALIHEIGHKIDFEIFDMRGIVGARYADKNLGPGVDYNGKVYSTREQVERDFKNGTLTKSEANNLLPSVDKYIKAKGKEKYSEIVEAARIKPVKFRNKTYKTDADIFADKSIPPDKASELLKKLNALNKDRAKNLDKLRQKFGADVVDGVMQRETFKKELDGLIRDIGYPQNKRTEAIAEFVYNYIADKRQVINSTPNFLAWFEKLLDNAPELKEALDNLKKDFATYDAQDVLTKAVAETKTPEDEKTPFLDGIVKIKDNFLYSFVNQLQYMKNLSEEWKKIVGDAYESFKDPFISAKQMLGIDGRVQQWLLHNPYFKRGGEIILRKDIKPLMQIVKPLIGKPEYEAYKAYLVALDSIESHNRNKPEQAYFDRETAQAVKKTAEDRFGAAKMIEFQGDIQKYNEALLDFMVESGRISKKTADYWKQEHQNYVPLRRIAEEYEILKGKKNITRDMLPESEKVIFARKGSQKQIKDIFESMIENTYKIIASSERNLLDRNILDAFKDIDTYNKEKGIPGRIVEEINEKDMEVYRDITTGEIRYAIPRYRPKNFRKPKGRIMGIYEEGVPRYYDIAREYYDPLFQGTQQMNHALQKFIRIASAPSRWLQAGAVVYDPTFPIRNIARDQMSAWFYSKHKYMPTEFIKGVASFLKHDDYYQKWLASGGDQSFLVSADMMMSKEYADKKIGTLTRRKFDAYKKNPLLALQDFSKASEIGTRLGAFRNAYKRTGDVNQAAIESRDVSADYGIKGQAVRNILPFYPFLNARTQHARMMLEAMKRPLEFTAKGMVITIPAILNWIRNNHDEEARKLYQSLPTWRRVGLFNIRIPGTDHFLPIPKGFFGVMFGSSVESMLDSAVGDDPRVAHEIAKQLFQEYSPISNMPELMPFVGRPPIEMWANKKGYTGKPIVSESMKLLKPSEQYYNSTPEIIKKMGEALNWSPVKIEHYFRSYTGGAGIGAVNILDATLQAMGIVDRKPEDSFTTLSRMPVFKALLTERPVGLQSGYVSDFYDTLDKIEKVNTTFNKYVATDNMEGLDKFMKDPENKRMYEFYEGNSTALNAFRSALTYARDSGYAVMKDETLSSAEKQEQIRDINNVVQESAIKFKEAYENNEFFDYGKAMDEIITKMREDKKDYRKDLSQQQLTYNPYYVQMREKDATTFNLLKEFGGLHEIEQRRKLSRGMETIDLELEDVRRFNESVVSRYATNVKNSLGTNRKLWETQQGLTQPGSPEKTQLQAMLEMAWSSAVEQTKIDFQPTQYKRVE